MTSSTQWIITMLWIIHGTAVALYVLGTVAGYSGDETTSANIRGSIWRYAQGCCWTAVLLVVLLFFFAPAMSVISWQESMVGVFKTSSQIWLVMCLAIWLVGRVVAVVMMSRKKAGVATRSSGGRLALPFVFGLIELAMALVMGA